MTEGNSSTTNCLLAGVKNLVLAPAGIGCARLAYDAFSAAEGDQSCQLELTGQKLLFGAHLKTPERANLFAPFAPLASALLVTIRPPFSLEITLDATANSEQSRIFRYRTDQGWSDQLAQYFQGVLLAAQTTIDLSLSALIESDKEAIDAYRADPVRLLQLTISRAKSG
jgi:hypothetical protein